MAAARIITYIEELQQELIANAAPDCPFDPPYTTIDMGKIHGGTANNIIPEYTRIDWGMRIVPGDDGPALEQRVRDYIAEHVDPGLKSIAPHAGVETELYNVVPPLMPDATSAAEQLIRHLTGLNQSGVVSFGTEAGLFQEAGMPTVVFGPGSIEQAHQPDEFIEISQLQDCIDFGCQLIDWAAQDSPGKLFN
jgi:acetylornithine deacetylase